MYLAVDCNDKESVISALRAIADGMEACDDVPGGINRDDVESAASDIRQALESIDASGIGDIPDNYIREIESVANSVQSDIESALGDIESALDQLDSLVADHS